MVVEGSGMVRKPAQPYQAGLFVQDQRIEELETTEGVFRGDGKLLRPGEVGGNGEILNYVAGLPFPNFDPADSQAGLKLAWSFTGGG
jgi:hypothetical protein